MLYASAGIRILGIEIFTIENVATKIGGIIDEVTENVKIWIDIL